MHQLAPQVAKHAVAGHPELAEICPAPDTNSPEQSLQHLLSEVLDIPLLARNRSLRLGPAYVQHVAARSRLLHGADIVKQCCCTARTLSISGALASKELLASVLHCASCTWRSFTSAIDSWRHLSLTVLCCATAVSKTHNICMPKPFACACRGTEMPCKHQQSQWHAVHKTHPEWSVSLVALGRNSVTSSSYFLPGTVSGSMQLVY